MTPLQISFRHLSHSPFIATTVRKRAERLGKFYPRITSIRVVIEPSERRHHQGRLYHVRIDLAVPGREIVVKRESPLNHAHENIQVAIRDAFVAAKRQLEDYVRIRFRGKQKHRESLLQGKVIELLPDQGYGLLEAPDGHEIYFHRNSVLNHDFTKMKIGEEVRFVEEAGEKGPQASTVHRIRKVSKMISKQRNW